MKSVIFTLIFGLFFLVGCTPTNENLTELTGGEKTTTKNTTVNGPLGNSALAFSPTSKDFGTLTTNAGSSSQTFTVTNSSIYTIFLGTLSGATTHFTVTANTCTNGLQMAANASCSITVQFAPLTTGNLSTAFSLPYDTTAGANSFSSNFGVNGAGTTLTGFGGLTTISAINITDVTLNWTDAGVNAGSYQVYEITSSGAAILLGNLVRLSVCGGGNCASQVTGLNPSSAYTFRVRATDTNGVQEQNIVNKSATTLTGQLDLTSSATTTAGLCLPVTITTKDSLGAATNVTTNSSITISGTSNAVLYSNAICTLPMTNPTIANGTSAKTFYLKDTTAEAITLAASFTTWAGDTQAVTITPDAADHLVYVQGNNQNAYVGFALTTDPKVQVVDQYGNAVSGVSISFLPTQGNGFATSSVVVTDVNGYATATYKVGGSEKYNEMIVRKAGTQLPDAAASGNATMLFSASSSAINVGVFSGSTKGGTLSSSYYAAFGDATNDGKLDMIVSNQNSTISYFTGNGNGTFGTAATLALANVQASGMQFEDFNGDGIKDLVAGSPNNNNLGTVLSLWISNGNGTFQARADSTVGTAPWNLVTGDFNGDGFKDVVTSNYGSSNISVLLGNGNGTFQAKVDYSMGTVPWGIKSGDFNGDGKPDVAVCSYGTNVLTIFYGQGTLGSYTFGPSNGSARVEYTTTSCYDLATGDLNGDSKPDIVVSGYNQNTIEVFLGQGSVGSYTFGLTDGSSRVDIATTTKPSSVHIVDIDGDGKLDIATNGRGAVDPTYTAVHFGNGDGTFQAYKTLQGEGTGRGIYNCYGLAAGDLNADGKADLACINNSTSTITFAFGAANKKFIPPSITYGSASFAVPADFNNDGYLDFFNTTAGTTGKVYLGTGTGTFTLNSSPSVNVGGASYDVTTADFNKDGNMDVAVANYTSQYISVLLGNGNGTFAAFSTITPAPAANTWKIASGDFNGDGYPDIASLDYTSYKLLITLNNGNGTFPAAPTTAYGGLNQCYGIVVGDYNNDKKMDIAIANYGTSAVLVFMGVGNGTFTGPTSIPASTNTYSIAQTDFNGDGNLDLVSGLSNGNINVFIGNGAGGFAAAANYNGSSAAVVSSLTTGDFNSDGKMDVVGGNYSGNLLNFYPGTGMGTLGARTDFAMMPNCGPANVMHAVDFNGDKKLDLLTECGNIGMYVMFGL